MDAQPGLDPGRFEGTSALFVRFLGLFLGTYFGVGADIVQLSYSEWGGQAGAIKVCLVSRGV